MDDQDNGENGLMDLVENLKKLDLLNDFEEDTENLVEDEYNFNNEILKEAKRFVSIK